MSWTWDVEGDEEFPELVVHAGGEMCFEIVAKGGFREEKEVWHITGK